MSETVLHGPRAGDAYSFGLGVERARRREFGRTGPEPLVRCGTRDGPCPVVQIKECLFDSVAHPVPGRGEVFDGFAVNGVRPGMASDPGVALLLFEEVCQERPERLAIPVECATVRVVCGERIPEADCPEVAALPVIVQMSVVAPYGLVVKSGVLANLFESGSDNGSEARVSFLAALVVG